MLIEGDKCTDSNTMSVLWFRMQISIFTIEMNLIDAIDVCDNPPVDALSDMGLHAYIKGTLQGLNHKRDFTLCLAIYLLQSCNAFKL